MANDAERAQRPIVARGVLRRRASAPADVPYTVRHLGPEDFAALRALHDEVVAPAPPGLVARESDAFLARNLGAFGLTFGTVAEGRLVAYGILSLPRDPDESLAAPWAADHRRVACLDGAGVLPAWRGNRLQRLLSRLRLEHARAAGRSHIAALSAPGNPYSWGNLMADGLAVRALERRHGGHWRYLLYRDFQEPPPMPDGPPQIVPAGDIERQQRLLAEGFVGIEGRRTERGGLVAYVRPAPQPGGGEAA